MLTLRIHLDPATRDNGPLEVLTGSHVTGKRLETAGFRAETILCSGGDVLAMRPLLVHSSGRSAEGTSLHRRIVHLEFAAEPTLPGGVRWHDFEPVRWRAEPSRPVPLLPGRPGFDEPDDAS